MVIVSLFLLFFVVTSVPTALPLSPSTHPLKLPNRVFVTDFAGRLRPSTSVPASSHLYDWNMQKCMVVTDTVSHRLYAGGLSEDQHPARLWGRHQDHVLEPEQDWRRHQAHLPSDWDLPSDGRRWKRAGIWQQHAVFTHHQYGPTTAAICAEWNSRLVLL